MYIKILILPRFCFDWGGGRPSSVSIGVWWSSTAFGGLQQPSVVFGSLQQSSVVFGGVCQSLLAFASLRWSSAVFSGLASLLRSLAVFGVLL